MLQVDNQTPFVPGLQVFPDLEGVDTLYVVLKATFALDRASVRVAAEQRPLVLSDELWGEPGQSSVRYASEAHLLKRATDVVVVGAGHAPGGRPTPRFGVSMAVGALRKLVQVSGDRVWRSGALGTVPSPPSAVESVPLLWERAYGGREDLGAGKIACEPRNPVGCGFLGRRRPRDLDGQPVPNVELPSDPLQSAGQRAAPAGVGFVAPSWAPRAGFAGTYDEAWQAKRAPYLPTDFDPRFFSAAPPDQVYPGFLVGGEPVELLNLSPAGPVRFALPTCTVEAEARIAGAAHKPRLLLETLLLEPDQGRFSMTWRGAVPCDKRVLKIEKVTFRFLSLAGATA